MSRRSTGFSAGWDQMLFQNTKRIFDQVLACSRQLGSVAVVWRRYAAGRQSVEEFRARYLIGSVAIPLDTWNAHIQLLEEVVVDTESFFWFANRLLTNVAVTLNYFLKKVRKISIPKGQRIRSHASLVESDMLIQLPVHLQEMAVKLNEEVARFRNERVEHDMEFWHRKSTTSSHQQRIGARTRGFAMHLEWSHRPLAEIWISLHDYLTEVAKFIGSEV